MNNLRYALARFMYGRYGNDALGYALMVLYFAVFAAGMFVHTFYLPIIGFLIVIWMFFRFFSRNIARRRGENEKFLRVFNKIKSFFKQSVRRLKDIRTHRYRTCPGCKVTLRLPIKRGKNTVICPRCKQRVQVRIWL